MRRQWVVLLEAAKGGTRGSIRSSDVMKLLGALDGGPSGTALHHPDRYALQVTRTAASPAEALYSVVSSWSHLVHELGLPAWEVVRTEVFTPEELQRDLNAHGPADMRVPSSAVPSSLMSPPDINDDLANELLRRAFSDSVTGLLSQGSFEHRLDDALATADGGSTTAVVCLALDGFRINDRFCGGKGDDVLREAAERVAGKLRAGDSLARLSGDRYAILLQKTTDIAALAVTRRVLDALHDRGMTEGPDLDVSARAGVALSQSGEDAQTLIGRADAALALAKTSGSDLHLLTHTPTCAGATPTLAPNQALSDRLTHFLLLQEAAIAANEADTLQQAVGVVLRQMRAHIGCAVGHLWVTPAANSDGLCSSVWHVSNAHDYRAFQEASDALVVMPGVGLPGRVLVSRAPVGIADLQADPKLPRGERSVAAGLASGFAFPIFVGREVVAVIECFSRERMEFSDSFLEVLSAVGTQLGRVVERQRAAAAIRRSKEQVQRSEAGMRQAQALAGLGSWRFDLHTGETSWTEEMYHHYGLDPSGPPLSLETALASVHPADRASVEAAVSKAVSGQRSATELRVLRPDGQLRWLRAEGMGIADDQGVVVAIHGTSQDITERKLMEEALRAREIQLSEAHRVARLGWWELDLATDRLTWSPEMYRLCELDAGAEVTLQRFYDMVHPDDRQRLLDNLARIRQPGEAFHVESPWVDYRAFTERGRERWFRARIQLLHDEQGLPVKLSGTMQDVTEEKLSEERLLRTKELYQRILERAAEGIFTLDAQDITTFANARLAQILGYEVDELPGMPASEYIDRATQAALFGHDHRRGAGPSEPHEARLRAKDGTFVQVLISASSLLGEEGQFGGTLAMVTDVSALRQAEAVLRTHSLRAHGEGDPAPDGPSRC